VYGRVLSGRVIPSDNRTVATVSAAQVFDASLSDAERCWNNVARWPAWVAELERVLTVDDSWPAEGSTVVWQSGPAGRGRVSERVVELEALSHQTVEVQDNSIRGRQSVWFTPVDGGVQVTLSLEYSIKRRSPLTWVLDTLFVRGPMTASLVKTLAGFGGELAGSRRSRAQ
jgi:Polyketide cyclase / dehydrase and lipid transport